MPKLTATKSNFVFNVALTISNLLFPLISFPYISRIIGPQGIGKVQFLLVFAQYFALVAALGIPIYGVREVAKRSGDRFELSKLFSELFVINIVSSLLLFTIYVILIFSFNKFQDDRSLYLIAGLVILLGFTSIDWLYSGLQDFKFITIRSLLIKIISLVALFLFVRTSSDVNLYLYITVFSLIANNIWNLLYLRKNISFNFVNLEIRKHLPILIVLFSTSISTSIYTVMDTLLLGFLSDETTVGYYTASIKINKIAIPLIVSLGVVLMPQIAKSMATGSVEVTQNLINKSFEFICLIAIPIAIGLFILAPEIMNIFSGAEFAPAVLAMKIASPLVFLIGIGHVFGLQILVPANHQKYYLYATICGMLTSLILNFLLITLFKEKGAALSTVIGEVVVSFVSYYYVLKYLPYRFNWSLAWKAILSSVSFVPIVYFFRYCLNQEFLILLFSVLSSCLIYFILQLFVFKDLITREVFAHVSKKIGLSSVYKS